ncbi:hypothetical protein BDV33DRAFT_185399, partial [Aspergillus novoparasiticus]
MIPYGRASMQANTPLGWMDSTVQVTLSLEIRETMTQQCGVKSCPLYDLTKSLPYFQHALDSDKADYQLTWHSLRIVGYVE